MVVRQEQEPPWVLSAAFQSVRESSESRGGLNRHLHLFSLTSVYSVSFTLESQCHRLYLQSSGDEFFGAVIFFPRAKVCMFQWLLF